MKKIVAVLVLMLGLVGGVAAQKPAGVVPAQPGLFRTLVNDGKAVGKTVEHGAMTFAHQLKRIFY